MKFWQSISYQTPEDCVALTKTAEEVGFDGVSFAEHIFHPMTLTSRYPYSDDATPAFEVREFWPEMWSTFAAMAMVTERIRFCSAVSILPLHNPFELAKASGTVARLSNNRVAIGSGAGWMKEEFDAFAVDFKSRGRRYNESIELMRKLWSGEPVSYQGEHFQCDEVIMLPPPERPVPIWVGGKSEAALRRAAYLGDGWLATGEPMEETLTIMARLAELRKQAGRDHLPFEAVAIQPFATLTDDDVQQLKQAGVTAIKNWTFKFVMDNPAASLAEKQDYIAGWQPLLQRHAG